MAKRKSGVGNFIADQPKWSKGIMSTAIVAGGGYLVYKLIGIIASKEDPTQKQLEKESKEYSKTQALTYPKSNYKGFADEIFNSWANNFNIFDSVDEDKIFAVYNKMQNDLDIIELTTAFGKRRLPINIGGLLLPDADLNAWINEGLTDSEKNKLNASLTAKGIKYQY